jgi:hypothetical protein
MAKQGKKALGPVVPPSPYDFEETVRRVLKAPPLPKKSKKPRKARKANA